MKSELASGGRMSSAGVPRGRATWSSPWGGAASICFGGLRRGKRVAGRGEGGERGFGLALGGGDLFEFLRVTDGSLTAFRFWLCVM